MRKRTLFCSLPALLAGLLASSVVHAQDSAGGPPPGSVTVPTQSGEVVVTPGATTTTTTSAPAWGTPQPGAEDPNSYLPSSSQPKLDTSKGDNFDMNAGGGGQGTVHGGKNSSATLGRSGAMRVPTFHTVRRGDTLWDLSGRYYQNPWNWPKVWSYNPQISNPHWIYPGDQVRMKLGGDPRDSSTLTGGGGEGMGGGVGDRRSSVPEDTIFLRNTGMIEDPNRDTWGQLVGAREDTMLLAEGNHVYLQMKPGKDLQVGQKLTVFRPVRKPENVKGSRRPPGQIIAIKGTVRIDQWNPDTRVARGEIVESVDAIERGAQVGEVGRRLDIVPPKAAKSDIWARVLTSTYPHEFYGQNQVVFIDRGTEDGLSAGNRLFVVAKGDVWRSSLKTAARTARDRLRLDVPDRAYVEGTPLAGDEKHFPEEIIGELRVLRANKYSSVTMVTVSHREIQPGDRAVSRKGY
jgi:LysM domain